MADELNAFWVHTVTVTPRVQSSYGPVDGEPVTVPGFLDESTRLVRADNGEQVVSSSTWYCALTHADLFAPGTKVTTPYGTATEVIGRQRHSAGGLDLPEHVEVQLA